MPSRSCRRPPRPRSAHRRPGCATAPRERRIPSGCRATAGWRWSHGTSRTRVRPGPRTPITAGARRPSAEASSLHRESVVQPALGGELVRPAWHAAGRERALPHLAVVADLRHDVGGPFLVEAHRRAEVAVEAENALDDRIGRARERLDVLRRDAELFGRDHGVVGVADDVEPALVALAHG